MHHRELLLYSYTSKAQCEPELVKCSVDSDEEALVCSSPSGLTFRNKAYVGESGICLREYKIKSMRSTYLVYIIECHIK
jgi:hypothetical protein